MTGCPYVGKIFTNQCQARGSSGFYKRGAMNEILKFRPIFKNVIWGGERIASFKNVEIDDDHIGESWELSPVKGNESVVAQGQFAGKTLGWMINEYGVDILGKRLLEEYGAFPLLIKFIDSSDDLSIQVHPDDELASKRHDSPGKTEMWYCLDPQPGAALLAGFSKSVSPQKLRRMAEDGTITDALTQYQVKKGDAFYLPAGRIHSIGRGNFLLEVQQASDVTYRLYDFGRLDADGKPRQLHLDEAEAAIDFNDVGANACKNISPGPGESAVVSESPFFKVVLTNIDGEHDFNFAANDSFTVLVATEGNFILDAGSQNVSLKQGETALVPWSLPRLPVKGVGSLVTIFAPARQN